MATIPYLIKPTGESSVSIELVRAGLRPRKHVLFFQHYSGSVEYDPDRLEHANVNLVIDVASMVCRDAWLKPPDRQAVTRTLTDLMNPRLTFQSRTVESVSLRRARVTGGLTLGGNTVSTSLDATIVPVGKDQLEIDFA